MKKLAARIASEFAVFEPYYRSLAVSVALVLAAASTYSAWNFASRTAWNEARLRFEFRASQIDGTIRDRMLGYEQVLRGASGLVMTSPTIEPRDWRTYLQQSGIAERYPGIQGFGFAIEAPAGRTPPHAHSVRTDPHDYAAPPALESAAFLPISYGEPVDAVNVREPQSGMLSQPAGRAAMERARDTGMPALSDRVMLDQGPDGDAQAGVILFVPLFRHGTDLTTVASRRAAVNGYVYALIRLSEVVRGIVGEDPDVRLQILDGAPGHTGALLYDSAPMAGSASRSPDFTATASLPMPGRDWTLQVQSLPALEATVDRRTPRIIATEGGVISALALAIIWSLATLRARASRLAQGMTRELRESRERLGLAIEGSNQALFDWDVRTGRVTLSEQWSRITGARGDIATIRDLMALVHSEDVRHVLQQTRHLLRGQLPFYHTEHRVRTRIGGWRWISSRAKVVERDGNGRATRVAGTNLDITERKEIERLKNEFIATVSHELRTPLTAVVGALGLVRSEAADTLSPSAAMFLAMAQQNSDRLAALINDILDIEKIESGLISFRVSPIAVGPLLRHAVALNTPYAGQFDVRFELRHPLPDVSVSGDEDRLLQVLTNLMSNAVKFSPKGSAVEVSCELKDQAVRIAVTDHGPGVPEAFRSRIFQKFAQADSGDTRQRGGTGLGLSICKAIVDKLGGTIGYQSAPGHGATFFLDLPLRT